MKGLILVLLAVVQGRLFDLPSSSDITPGGLSAAIYDFNVSTYSELALDVTVTHFEEKAPDYFFAHQFNLANSSNNGGYLGIQGEGSWFNDTEIGKAFIFSIWDGVSSVAISPEATCGRFGGEGTGLSCRMPYRWVNGHTYRMRVVKTGDHWWTATIQSLNTSVETIIGSLQSQPTWGDLSAGTLLFIEYYGDEPSCASLPFVQVVTERPVVTPFFVPPPKSTSAPYGRCKPYATGSCQSASKCTMTAGTASKK